MADVPSEALQVYKSRSLASGLNTWSHPIDLRDDEAVLLQNITTDTPGLRQMRKGTSLVATGITAGPIYGVGSLLRSLIVVSASEDAANDHKRLWKWAGSGGQFTYLGPMTGYTLDGLYRVVQCWDAAMAGTGSSGKGAVVIMPPDGGVGVYRWYYDGTALAQTGWGKDGNQPKGSDFEYFLNYGFGVGNTKTSVWMSNVASPLFTGFLNTTSQFLMGGDTEYKIVAIKGFRSRELVVFMSNRIEELVIGDPSLRFSATDLVFGGVRGITAGSPVNYTGRRVIDTTIGCSSRHSIAKVSEDMYFADQRGNIRSLARTALDASQGTKSLPLSIKIQSYIDRINGNAIDQICAAAYDRFYIVAFALDSDTSPGHVFVYDTVRGAWDGPWTGINPKMFKSLAIDAAAASAADKIETIYAGTSETTEGRVVRLFRGTSDFGTAISYSETSKQIDGGAYELYKTWVRIELLAIATADVDILVEANPDQSGWISVGTANVLGSTVTLPFSLPQTLGGTGIVRTMLSLESLPRSRTLQFRFTASSTDAVKVLGYTMYFFSENFDWGG